MLIEDPHKRSSHIGGWLGLIAIVLALAAGIFFLIRSQYPHQEAGVSGYLKPVPSDSQLRSRLSDAQYHVTRENGTETAFQNLYWDNVRPGLYVDVITGEPLFSSRDKFEANTGRPSFTKPISPERLEQRADTSFNMNRIEIRAIRSNSHLGHLFKDGPPPTGLRYAINSAALHFVTLEDMPKLGYGDFISFVSGPEATAAPQQSPTATTPAK
jgi:peptide methionine sulfoxide reductase msrA/msrB